MMQAVRHRQGSEPRGVEVTGQRTSFPDAVDKILETTPDNSVISISELAHKSSLNRKTVEKGIDLILLLEKKLGEREIVLIEAKGRKLISAKRREPGLLSLPHDLQKTIIRSVYFPLPSREEEILTHLYLRNARDRKNAIFLSSFGGSNDLIDTLIRQEYIGRTGERYYLTEDGFIVAVGALDLYPELKGLMDKALA